MKTRNLLATLLLCLCFGCVTGPTQQQLEAMDLGPVPVNYQEPVKKYLDEALFDPYSAHIEFLGAPRKAWYREPAVGGGKLHVGYLIPVAVNAKNRMGGYTGKQLYGFLFKNDQLDFVIDPDGMSRMKL